MEVGGAQRGGLASTSTYLVVGMLFAYPMFGQLLPDAVGLAVLLSGAILAFAWCVTRPDFLRLRIGFVALAWLLLALYAVGSHVLAAGTSRDDSYVLLLAVILMIAGSSSAHWVGVAVRVVFFFSGIHALATIFFYFNESAYFEVFKPLFFAESFGATGYAAGLSIHYSYNGLYCAVGLVIAAARALASAADARTKARRWVLVGMFLFALVLTAKRAHLLFAILAIVLVYLYLGKKWRYIRVALVLAAGYAVMSWAATLNEGIASALSRILETFEEDDLASATSGRTFLWEAAITGWQESPIFGNGWSSFFYQWPGTARSVVLAHNEILNVLYEGGVVGLVLFLVAAVSALFMTLRLFSSSRPELAPDRKIAAAVALGLQLFLVVYAVTTGGMLTDPYVFSFYFLAVSMALAISSSQDSVVVERADTAQPLSRRGQSGR